MLFDSKVPSPEYASIDELEAVCYLCATTTTMVTSVC